MYIIAQAMYMQKIMTFHQALLELFPFKVRPKTCSCSSKKAARGPKPIPLTLCPKSYLPLKNQFHSMSRTRDIKTGSSAAVPYEATRRPVSNLTFVLPTTTHLRNIMNIHAQLLHRTHIQPIHHRKTEIENITFWRCIVISAVPGVGISW